VDPLDVLYDVRARTPLPLPDELTRLYGGELGFDGDRLYANFVSTLDGVVAIPSVPESNKLISGESDADRFVMALLRACADAIVIGSGTFHGSPRGLWTAESAFPDLRDALADLRRRRQAPPQPELVVLTASGALDVGHPALERGALVLTTDDGDRRLRGRLPSASSLESLGDAVDVGRAVQFLRERGHSLVLSEAGPHVFGALLAAGVVDELFLTYSPLLAGRDGGDRLQLVEGAALLPDLDLTGEVLSVRASGSYLLLRYSVRARA
jgi:riboflavin biosynthesis pyrimidine reductase